MHIDKYFSQKKAVNYIYLLLFSCLCVIVSCNYSSPSVQIPELVRLEIFDRHISVDDATLAAPVIIRYDQESLFIFDAVQGKILKLDDERNIVREYGRSGRGPGEFQIIQNLTLTDRFLYAIDVGQFLIHKYDRNGDFITSLEMVSKTSRPNTPMAPFSPGLIRAPDLDNLPFVTIRDHVMFSSVFFEDEVEAIYELKDWEGNRISAIGDVPEGSAFIIDYKQLADEVANRKIPSIYKPNAFPVSDRSDTGSIYLVYSAIPKIAKYSENGQKIWEKEVSGIPEIEAQKKAFFENMERMQQSDPRNRIVLKYYNAGVSNESGELFLISSYRENIWIHRFNSDGELTARYELKNENEGVKLQPIFDIDFSAHRIFIVTDNAEVWSYLY